MTTKIRPELSKENKYYVEKHRYYELKHFCLQYPKWKRIYIEEDGLRSSRYDDIYSKKSGYKDPTYKIAENRVLYLDNIKIVEQAAIAADSSLYTYILKAVTEDLSFNQLKTKLNIPCGRDMYYDRYRKFFWILDKTKS